MHILLRKLETRIPCTLAELPTYRNFIGGHLKQYDVLHNHQEDGTVQYRYPVMQYRCNSKGFLEIVALGQALEVLPIIEEQKLLEQCSGMATEEISISYFPSRGDNKFKIYFADRVKAPRKEVDKEPQQLFYYTLSHAILYRSEDYDYYKNLPNLYARIACLEQSIKKYVVSMLYEVAEWAPDEFAQQSIQGIQVSIMDIIQNKKIPNPYTASKHKKGSVPDFNVDTQTLLFAANIKLPKDVAIGHAVGYGFGVIQEDKIK